MRLEHLASLLGVPLNRLISPGSAQIPASTGSEAPSPAHVKREPTGPGFAQSARAADLGARRQRIEELAATARIWFDALVRGGSA